MHIDGVWLVAALATWAQAHRYVRELTCDERLLYAVEPLCASQLSSAPIGN